MNLHQQTVATEAPRILSGQSAAPPQENLSVVLEQTLNAIADGIRYADQMIEHVGNPIAEENHKGCPSVGVMGRAFDLRSQVHRLNAKLEQLAALL